jgi:hypothetical protein
MFSFGFHYLERAWFGFYLAVYLTDKVILTVIIKLFIDIKFIIVIFIKVN